MLVADVAYPRITSATQETTAVSAKPLRILVILLLVMSLKIQSEGFCSLEGLDFPGCNSLMPGFCDQLNSVPSLLRFATSAYSERVIKGI